MGVLKKMYQAFLDSDSEKGILNSLDTMLYIIWHNQTFKVKLDKISKYITKMSKYIENNKWTFFISDEYKDIFEDKIFFMFERLDGFYKNGELYKDMGI